MGTNLDAPSRNLRNIDDIHADEPAQKTLQAPCRIHMLPLLNRHGWEQINFNKTGNVRINVTLGRVRVTAVAAEKQLSTTYSECVSSLRYPAPKVMRSVARPAVPYFSKLSHKCPDFRGKSY